MTYTLKDIKHLGVMADLANATPVPPRKINVKALLAEDAVARESTVSEKILTLCSKLRNEGFEKQAESLESKFLAYKAADVHLYRVHDEDGEDLVNAAHPDGDAKVEDADKALGDVETIISRHKKMVDVITKEPTGKLGSKNSGRLSKYVQECNAVLKQAQAVDPASMGLYSIYKIWQGLKQSFGDIKDKSEILKDKLESLLSDSDAQKHKALIDQINIIIPALNKVMNIGPQVEQLQVNPQGKVKEVKKYKRFFDQLQNALATLKSKIIAAYDASENSMSSKLYHVVVTSTFIEAKISITELDKSLSKIIQTLNSLDTSGTPAGDSSIDLSFEENSSIAPQADTDVISQLQSWSAALDKKDIPPQKKEQGKAWIASQIKELQENAGDSAKLQKILAENKEFQQDWKL